MSREETVGAYCAENPDGYKVDESGIIRNPGKFEGEPLYVPFFYNLGLCGFADVDTTNGDDDAVWLFAITCDDAQGCPALAGVTVLAIVETDSGFVESDIWEGESMADVEELFFAEREAAANDFKEPCEGDYMITPCGALGSRCYVGVHEYAPGIGEFGTIEEAHAAIRERMAREQFFPNVWNVNDHGNVTLAEFEARP